MNPRRLTPSMSVLVAFEAAARHGSFTKAADELSLTQSAVSRQVQALEALLGVDLFNRDGRRIDLTAAGALYQHELSAALGRIRSATLQTIAFRSQGGTLNLAVLPTFGSKWLLPRMNDFYTQHPDIVVHIHSRIMHADLASVAGGDARPFLGAGIGGGITLLRFEPVGATGAVVGAVDGKTLQLVSARLGPVEAEYNHMTAGNRLYMQVAFGTLRAHGLLPADQKVTE